MARRRWRRTWPTPAKRSSQFPAGRQLVLGQLERVEWASAQNSRLVDLAATVGGSLKTIALNLPDRGNFDWIVPEWATSGTATLQANFKTTTGSSISGTSNASGTAVFPLTTPPPNPPRLANISTRGQVSTGFDVMIGGFVVQGSGPQNVIIRAIGPSLANFGVSGALANPTMSLVRMSDNATIATNDDWGSAANAGQISSSGFAPSNALESAILISLQPGAYTAVVSGVNNGSGVGLVEVYTLP